MSFIKKILILIICVLLYNCDNKPSAPNDILKLEAEKRLLPQLNDPKSYEFVSFVVDTNKRMQTNQRMQDLSKLQSEYQKDSAKNEYNLMKIEDEISSTKAQMLPANEIEFLYKFRAKNHFNATVLHEKIVVSDNKFNFLRIED
ncbi:hypothetical protein [Flavobacterium sp. 1355]|uniref:hypothetical protein n=1 Tax=Flavobacterium sp. 1355 TaxID=2806571 RepID=UPI001AE6B3C4|nr:hypothetical protein [Flavobacterium sp. 1355]MBP1222601.1 hypothetical protein [Flavobacterium sp. 1355]